MARFADLAIARAWAPAGAALRFELDGERLAGDETAAALDMDDGDLVDVVVAGG
jgi:hypothetical protein